MTETANYKLKKPGVTDYQDVEVLNENMDIIDEQLGKAGYFELDLREVTDFDIFDGEKSQNIDITESVNADELFAAAADGKVIRLRTKDSAMGSDICVLLTDYTDLSDDSGTVRVIQGSYWYNTASSDFSHFQILQWGNSVRLRWTDTKIPTNVLSSTGWTPNQYLGTDAEGNVVAVAAPGGGAEKLAKDIRVVKSGSTITLTATLEDDTQSVTDIALDENGYPVTVTTDGEACSVGWEGFDTTETAALPVVELSTVLDNPEGVELSETENTAMSRVAESLYPCVVTFQPMSGMYVTTVCQKLSGGGVVAFQSMNGLTLTNESGSWVAIYGGE